MKHSELLRILMGYFSKDIQERRVLMLSKPPPGSKVTGKEVVASTFIGFHMSPVCFYALSISTRRRIDKEEAVNH